MADQEETDYIINQVRQIGIKAASHDEALKAVMDGGGNILSANYAVNIRPQAAAAANQVRATASLPPPTKP